MGAKSNEYTGRIIKAVRVLTRAARRPHDTCLWWKVVCLKCGEEYEARSSQLMDYSWNGHKCETQQKQIILIPGQKEIIPADHYAVYRKRKAYRKTWSLKKTAAFEVMAYQRETGDHVSIGW